MPPGMPPTAPVPDPLTRGSAAPPREAVLTDPVSPASFVSAARPEPCPDLAISSRSRPISPSKSPSDLSKTAPGSSPLPAVDAPPAVAAPVWPVPVGPAPDWPVPDWPASGWPAPGDDAPLVLVVLLLLLLLLLLPLLPLLERLPPVLPVLPLLGALLPDDPVVPGGG
jgi:hypothetical protein